MIDFTLSTLSKHLQDTNSLRSSGFLLYFYCVHCRVCCCCCAAVYLAAPIFDRRPSFDNMKPAGVFTCVCRTEVGQGYDLVASSDTLHHVVAAVLSPTATWNEREMHKCDATACSKHCETQSCAVRDGVEFLCLCMRMLLSPEHRAVFMGSTNILNDNLIIHDMILTQPCLKTEL